MGISVKLGGKDITTAARYYMMGKKIDWKTLGLNQKEVDYVNKSIEEDKRKLITIPRVEEVLYIQTDPGKPLIYQNLEELRANGLSFANAVNSAKLAEASIYDLSGHPEYALAVAEGICLGSYQFLKYRKEEGKEINSLKEVTVFSKKVTDTMVKRLNVTVEAVFIARDLVNEPQSYLNALQLASEFEEMGKEAGFKVEVLNETKIEALKMGGLLAVNLGSKIPPTFTIMEWKPAKVVNKNPIVLVGKGVVYDTGGLSLKPTLNSMDAMKSDMAGAAVVGACMYAIAKMKLPVYVVALVPATDNRPGQDAYTPGDVVKMFNGLMVEVLNTDAEGRMILADALAYAKKFKPELVMDFATLTGAAAAAIGHFGIVCMGTADEKAKHTLKQAGDHVYERLVEFPFWDEYGDLIKSDIADLKNVGGPVAGAITAGKFLENFTDYPWMYFDIAGPAFITKNDSYRGKNGTGVGVRLLIDYFSRLSEK